VPPFLPEQAATDGYGGGFQAHLRSLDWDFAVVDSPQVNAFVVPGGKVVVYTGEGVCARVCGVFLFCFLCACCCSWGGLKGEGGRIRQCRRVQEIGLLHVAWQGPTGETVVRSGQGAALAKLQHRPATAAVHPHPDAALQPPLRTASSPQLAAQLSGGTVQWRHSPAAAQLSGDVPHPTPPRPPLRPCRPAAHGVQRR
jgi:hypothetical protein